MGVEVLSYDFELKPEKGVEIAELMVQQGVQFATIIQAFEDVNDQIARILTEAGIQSIYYAVPPKTATGYPYLTLPDVSTGVKLGAWQGEYAQDNWDGVVDYFVIQIGQEAQGVTSELRLQGGRDGLDLFLGALPDEKYVYVDAGDGTVKSAQNAAAAVLPSYPDAKNIIGIAMHDGVGTGLARALEAAGRHETACVSGQPGTPEMTELQRGGESAFRVSALQILAFASWQVALGIYALEGGELPDVAEFDSVLVTAETVGDIPSQSNEGYTCPA